MQDTKAIWLAIIALFAVMVGVTCGLLSWIGGMNPANSILTGVSAFAGAMALMMTTMQFVADRHAGTR